MVGSNMGQKVVELGWINGFGSYLPALVHILGPFSTLQEVLRFYVSFVIFCKGSSFEEPLLLHLFFFLEQMKLHSFI